MKPTPVHSRFQACCDDGCGLIGVALTKAEAVTLAERHASTGCESTCVWDLMHRRGDTDGIVWRNKNHEVLK